MKQSLRCIVAASLCAATGAVLPGSARGASEPVYMQLGTDGKPSFSNRPSAGATLLLAADLRPAAEFTYRFRTQPQHENRGRDAVMPRNAGLPRRLDPVLLSQVDAVAASAGLDADLVRAVVLVESGFRFDARSPAGASGLMQLMPATAARFGVTDVFDRQQNLRGGTAYLVYLLRLFNGDVRLALAGYNAGEGAVIKHGRRIPPYAETQAYVPAVLSAWRSFSEARPKLAAMAGEMYKPAAQAVKVP